MLKIWPVLLRFAAALYLVVLSFEWLSLIKSNMPVIKALGGMTAGQGAGFVAFFIALFLALPHVWGWRPDRQGPGVALFNKLGRGAWGLFGALIALLGLALTASSVFALGPLGMPTAVLAVVTGVALLGGGGAQVWSAWQAALQQGAPSHERQAAQIKRVAGMARASGGRLSVGEVAADLGLPRPEAAALMRRMAEEGWCEERVNSSGAGFYYFADFADPNAKHDIFEDADGVVFGHEQAAPHEQSRRR